MESEAASIYFQNSPSIENEEQQLEFRALVEDKEKYLVLDMGGNDLGLTFTIMSLIQPVILKISENNVARNRSSEVDISNSTNML